jgi:DNA invertase Pin-like site-specific DNA recombinase
MLGDVVLVTRLAHLGRGARNLGELVAELGERMVDLVVVEPGIDTTTPTGKVLSHIPACWRVTEWTSC